MSPRALYTLIIATPLLPLIFGAHRPTAVVPFRATIDGAVSANPTGSAVYGAVSDGSSQPRFTLTLGAESDAGTIAFTLGTGVTPVPGNYSITDTAGDLSQGETRALVVVGSPTKPRGAFRARSGTLRITEAATGRFAGEFELEAIGFLSERPKDESVVIAARGKFEALSGPEAD